VAVYALALGVAQGALTIDSTPVAPPEDIIGEHQPLQKTWTISSVDELEKLHLLIPGRVFIDVEENLPTVAPIPVEIPTPTPAATTPDVASVDGSESEDSEEGEIVVVVDESSSSAFASLEAGPERTMLGSASRLATGLASPSHLPRWAAPTPAPQRALLLESHCPTNRQPPRSSLARAKWDRPDR